MELNEVTKKLLFISKLSNIRNNLLKSVNVLNKLKDKSIDNKINNNLVKMFRISVECNAFDENEDKQRQCYKQFICFWPKCRFSTEYKCFLNRHISTHLDNRRQFNCNQCNKVFIEYVYLIQHKRYVHSNEKRFVCHRSDCQKRFKTNGSLTRHKRFVHSSEKPYKCTECDKRFKDLRYLNRHKLIHLDIKPFKCHINYCGKRFGQKSDLNTHINRHNGIKRYKCFHNNCDKSFVNSSDLRGHIAYKHSIEKPFKCLVKEFNRFFKTKSLLTRHIKNLH